MLFLFNISRGARKALIKYSAASADKNFLLVAANGRAVLFLFNISRGARKALIKRSAASTQINSMLFAVRCHAVELYR